MWLLGRPATVGYRARLLGACSVRGTQAAAASSLQNIQCKATCRPGPAESLTAIRVQPVPPADPVSSTGRPRASPCRLGAAQVSLATTSQLTGRQMWNVACQALRSQPLLNSDTSRALSHTAALPQHLLLSRCAGGGFGSELLHRTHQAVRRAERENIACLRRQSPRSWSAPSEPICARPGGVWSAVGDSVRGLVNHLWNIV